MKTFIAILVLLSPMFALAAETCSTSSGAETVEEQLEIKTDVPKHLQGATICVVQADHKMSCVPAEKFKVVPRKQQFIVSKTKQVDKTSCTTAAEEAKRNRISLLAGRGTQEGVDRSSDGNKVTVESKVGAVGGAQYQRLLPVLDDRLSIGAQLQTNKTILLNVGLDF